MSRSIAVPNRAAGQSRAASNPPTITMPSDVTFYNDDAVTNFQIRLSDDRGMDKITASGSNKEITGVTSPNYPATSRRGPGDLWTYDYRGNRTGYQTSRNIGQLVVKVLLGSRINQVPILLNIQLEIVMVRLLQPVPISMSKDLMSDKTLRKVLKS